MTTFSKRLAQIIKNKKNGSSELVGKLNALFLEYRSDHKSIKQSIPLIKKELNHFTVIDKYLRELGSVVSQHNEKKMKIFLSEYSKCESDRCERIFSKLYKYVPDAKKIITISRSGTLLNVIKLWHQKNKKLKVIICESRPKFEGRFLAQDIINLGIKVELITDAMMSYFVSKVDAAIIGTDSVLKNGDAVNKVGSKSLALHCKENKIPFYIVTTRSKFSNKNHFKQKSENPDEVWRKQHKNLKVSNIYFEIIEKKLITKILTD